MQDLLAQIERVVEGKEARGSQRLDLINSHYTTIWIGRSLQRRTP